MELAEASEKDLETLAKLWHRLGKKMEQYSDLNKIDPDHTLKDSEKGFRKHLEDEEHREFLIKDSGKFLGFLTLKHGRHPSREISRYTEIVNLFIKEEYRSQGYGSKAIEKVKDIARENGSEYLKVSSEWENQGARSFYTKNGFKEKQVKYTQKLD